MKFVLRQEWFTCAVPSTSFISPARCLSIVEIFFSSAFLSLAFNMTKRIRVGSDVLSSFPDEDLDLKREKKNEGRFEAVGIQDVASLRL